MVGNGSADAKVLASLGTTTTVLHGNAAGLPTFGAVSLTADVSGVLPVANFATGTPNGSKFVRDDGVLAVPGGSVAGSNKQIQYNNSSAFGAEAGFEYDAATNTFSTQYADFGDGSGESNSLGGDPAHFVRITNAPSSGAGFQLMRFNAYGTTAVYENNVHWCRYRGTIASPTAVQSGDTFMSFGYRGYDGSALSQSAASFAAVATQNWTGSAHGIKYVWQVTANGSTTRANGMELTSAGLDVTGILTTTGAVTATGAVTGSNLSGTNTGDQTISDATISTSDITTNNVSITKHGFAPKAPNDATKYLDGTGAYSVPAGAGGSGTVTSVATPNLTTAGVQLTTTNSTTTPSIAQSASVGFLEVVYQAKSAAYTTVLTDSGKGIDHPSTDANARTFTIDSNANVAYPAGTCITFTNMTSQVVTIAITSDTMYLAGSGSTGSRSLAQYGVATARKLTSTTWMISGTGLS
jgi:hypothetical protein